MKKVLFLAMVFVLLSVGNVYSQSQYVPGVEGLDAGSYLPKDEGLTIRLDNLFYVSDKFKNSSISNFDDFNYSLYFRAFYNGNIGILGGKWVPNINIPFVFEDLEYRNFNTSDFNVANAYIEPVAVIWEFNNFDFVFSGGIFVPTSNDKYSFSRNYITGLVRLGGTYYLGDENPFILTGLLSYEVNSDVFDSGVDISVGNDLTLEYGVGRFVTDDIKLGVVGYAQWKVDPTDGPSTCLRPNFELNPWNVVGEAEIYALGPQIDLEVKKWDLMVSAKSLFEFGADNRSEGILSILSITKLF